MRDESNPRNATMTDNNGRFSLSNVRAKQISIHYIGYQLLKVAVSDSPLSITLVEDNKDLGEVVVVADAGMLSMTNLQTLHEAGLGFIVGSRPVKAPGDLAKHFRWHRGRVH